MPAPVTVGGRDANRLPLRRMALTAATVLALCLPGICSAHRPGEHPLAGERSTRPRYGDDLPTTGSAEEATQSVPNGDSASQDHLAVDPCAVGERDTWIEWMDARLTRSVCSTARWFDNLFGGGRSSEEREATFGRLGLGAKWDEDDGLEEVIRFRAKYHLPNLERRVNILVGGGEKAELDDEEALEGGAAKDLFFSDDSEWLLGFGTSRIRSRGGRASFDLGARFSNGVDPYVRVGLTRYWNLGPSRAVRVRVTPQWRETRGIGATSSVSLEHLLDRGLLLRYEVTGQAFDKKLEGVAYSAGVVLHQHLGRGRAIRYGVSASGETGEEVRMEDVGFLVTYRQSIYEEILFLETFGGVNWRRRFVDADREPKAVLGLVAELKFGR